MLAAMDGNETPSTDNVLSQTRTEPTAFFLFLFGLVYYTICLRHHPEYSGRAIWDIVIFNEFSSLCYNMAMTKPAIVQVHLVESHRCAGQHTATQDGAYVCVILVSFCHVLTLPLAEALKTKGSPLILP